MNDGNCETILIDEAADGNATIDRDVEISGEDGPAYIFGKEAGSTVTLGDLLISKGSADQGGGIDNAGTLTLTNTFVSESSATNGGGIYNSGTLTLESSGISENEAAQYVEASTTQAN